MKRIILFLFAGLMIFSTLARAQNNPDNRVLKNVVCRTAQEGVQFCTAGELKEMIQSLRLAKKAGEETKTNSLGVAVHQAGKGMLVIGGTWFATSVAAAILEAELGVEVTYYLTRILSPIFFVNVAGGGEIPRRLAESFLLRGFTLGLGMAAAGGVIMALTPSKAADGTMTAYYAADENFGKLLNLEDEHILSLVEQKPELGNKIVAVASIAMNMQSQK